MSKFLGKLKDMISGGQSDYAYYEEEMENMSTNDSVLEEQNTEAIKESKNNAPYLSSPSPAPTPTPSRTDSSRKLEAKTSYDRNTFSRSLPDNVIGMPGVNNMVNEVVIIAPHSPNDIPQVIQTLREQRCVILNLNVMEPEEAQRALDFVAGGTFAIDGVQERIGESIFLFTPRSVKVSTVSGQNYQNKSSGFSHDALGSAFTDSFWDDNSGQFNGTVGQ